MAAEPWPDYDQLTPDDVRKRAAAEAAATLRVLTSRLTQIQSYEKAHQNRPGVMDGLGDLRKDYNAWRNNWTNRWTNRW
jgi:hypothetical protein